MLCRIREGVLFVMLLAVISAAVCLAVATMMYTPKMRTFRLYRPVALIFLFEGVWLLVDYIVRQISPDNNFTMIIHYIGLIVLGAYLILRILFDSNDKINDKLKDKLKKKKD